MSDWPENEGLETIDEYEQRTEAVSSGLPGYAQNQCRPDCPENCPENGCHLRAELEYKGWEISYNPKPIGTRDHDWDATHDDYDGDNGMYLTAGSVHDCHRLIDEFIESA